MTKSVKSKVRSLKNTASREVKNLDSGNFKDKIKKAASTTVGGITVVEIALLGAAGVVVWKNRAKIQKLLEKNGISASRLLSGDLSELIQTGAKFFGNKAESFAASNKRSMMHHS